MLRRLASLGHTSSDDQLPSPMSPSPGDEQDARASGGLAGVFKGLAGGGKLTKSPPPSHQSLVSLAASQSLADRSDSSVALPAGLRGLAPDQVELYGRLKDKNVLLSERVAAASSLRYAIADFPLNPILDIWEAGKDLIEPEKPAGARQAGWELLTECVKCPTSTELERREYYDTVTSQAHPEDFHLQLAVLEDLTSQGRNVSGFSYDIFPLLVKWLQSTHKAVKTARRSAQRGPGRPPKGLALGEEKNLSQLFTFITHVIKFNSKFARETAVGYLLDVVEVICMSTSYEQDLRMCIDMLNTIVTFGSIPMGKLQPCIYVLSSIHCVVPQLKKEAWKTIANICKSHHGQSTIRILLGVLRNYSPAQNEDKNLEKENERELVRKVRGALSVLKKLLFKSPDKGFPLISLALLMDGLEHVATAKSTRIATEVLSLINTLLDDPDTSDISAIVAEEHWSMMFAVAAKCAVKAHSTNAADSDASLRSPLNKDESEPEYTVKGQLIRLLNRIERLLVQKGADFLQRDECLAFLTEVHQALPDSTAGLVINHFKDSRSCLPSDADWKKNLNIALDGFYLNRNRDPLTRLHALEVAVEVYNFLNLAEDLVNENEAVSLIRRLLAGISEETNTLVLQDTVTFLVQVAETATPSLFAEIMDDLKKVVAKDMAKAPLAMLNAPKAASYVPGQTIYVANQSLSNVVTRGYIQIFIRTLICDGSKASKAFMALVHIARSNSCEVDARLTAMKMIFRLRADSDYQIYLSTLTENESLAGTLYRTEASLARKLAEDAAQPLRLSRAEQGGIASRPSRGVSFSQGQTGDRVPPARQAHTPKPAVPKGQRLWSVPDADALPETPPERPSWVLVSYKDYEDGGAELREPVKMVLNVSAWLEALLSLFHNGCDWEVYSFVLVHLPSQLSNHPFFRGAVTYIHELRRFFCEMIKANSFQEPPSSSGLRRTDVGNCLFHSLIMILSYHEHFQKVDEDDLVRTFIHGITDKTAKTCIHALQICCHELPLSLSKSLVTILQKMSQVITQPLVAMHILEFLACLSRMQSLYTNFREDEYRLIFGICARYLQSVRDKKQNAARSTPHTSEPSTPSATAANQPEPGLQPVADDLPQYVHALAYHVIIFWFLAVKLHDRPSHIPWIAKNLFVDSDGKATNEEQALVTLDFMQRVAFSDACDSAQDTNFNEQHYGEIQKKRWIIGNSIVTIRQAKETGWAEITRRYPSGTSAFAIRVEFTPMPNQTATDSSAAASREERFQHGITIFPSHLLMQLLAPMPQMSDPAMRPIPLPDDDGVNRAIRTFDRNSTVDGHKVGVIYIADGQTNELEILTNTIGGPDYLEFLNGLGSLTRLKGASFNTQGLDTHDDMDGQYAYCWRDRVTEIVFHVTTQMPNHPHDAQCIFKKRHIGNDFVNIIWNDSGLPFRFDQFPSQFNYVYIIITPTPRRSFAATRELASKREGDSKCHSPFYMVQVMSAPGFPEISPAAEPKLVSLGALPSLVRLVALNASVFSLVWSSRDGEHVSSWRNRLQEINRLRERYGPKGSHPSGGLAPSPPPNALAAAAAAAGGIPTLQVMQTAQGGSGAGGGMTMDSMMAGGGGMSRPPSGMRDSFSSLRRSSVATFFTSGGSTNNDPMSHRSSLLSTTTADNTEIAQVNATEALVDSVDFSKWT